MNSFEIDIQNSHSDIRGWFLWRLFHSTMYICYLILDVLIASFVLFFTDFGENDYESVVFLAVIIGIIPIAGCLGLADKMWKQIKGGQRILRFESDGIRSSNEQIEIFYKWSMCKNFTETPKYLFAETVQGRTMFFLSKKWLTQEMLDNLWRWMDLNEINIVKIK